MLSKNEIIERVRNVLSDAVSNDVIPFKDVLSADTGVNAPIGKDENGEIKYHSVPRLPNLLVAGTSGSGKSNFINSLVLSLMLTNTPQEMQFILVDPKMVEFDVYNGLAHLYNRHVYNAEDMDFLLDELHNEMIERFNIFRECNVQNVSEYNEWAKEAGAEILPYVVVIVDEFGEVEVNDVTDRLLRVVQKCRSAGIHFILASQSPERSIINCALSTYFCSKLIFRTYSVMQSWNLLDKPIGTDLKPGEAFFCLPSGKVTKLNVPYVAFSDVKKTIEILKEEYD